MCANFDNFKRIPYIPVCYCPHSRPSFPILIDCVKFCKYVAPKVINSTFKSKMDTIKQNGKHSYTVVNYVVSVLITSIYCFIFSTTTIDIEIHLFTYWAQHI